MNKGQTRWFEVGGVLSLLGAFSFFMFHWGLEGIVHERKVQIVPDLKGKSIASVLDLISPLNLAIRKEGVEFNSSVPIGSVLRQTPPAGTKVREGKILRLVISQGGVTVLAPKLLGLPLRNAEMLLRENQLGLGQVTESYSLRMEKGVVLSQEPKAESSVGRDSSVNIVVSGGVPPSGVVLMPDFVRKESTAASAWAQQVGVRLDIKKDPGSLFPYGVVLSQNLPPDSVIGADSRVQLIVSGKESSSAGPSSAKMYHYAVPQGSSDNQVKILLEDQSGERELFNGLRAPGSKVDVGIPSSTSKHSRVRVYLNGILVEEQDL